MHASFWRREELLSLAVCSSSIAVLAILVASSWRASRPLVNRHALGTFQKTLWPTLAMGALGMLLFRGPMLQATWLVLAGVLALNVVRIARQPTTSTALSGTFRIAVWSSVITLCIHGQFQRWHQQRALADTVVLALNTYRAHTGIYPTALADLGPPWNQEDSFRGLTYVGFDSADPCALPVLRYFGPWAEAGDSNRYDFAEHRWRSTFMGDALDPVRKPSAGCHRNHTSPPPEKTPIVAQRPAPGL